jgi:hypothetical protein
MNVIYPKAKELMLSGQLDWANDPIAIALYTSVTVYNPVHSLITDLVGTFIAGGTPLVNKEVIIDLATANSTTYFALENPATISVAVMYRVSDARLIAYLDDVTGFSLLPTGADYTLAPSGPSGAFFRL